MMQNLLTYVFYTNLFIIWYFLIVNFGYILLLVASIPDIFSQFKSITLGNIDYFVRSKSIPPITAILPAFNESKDIIYTIQSLLKSDYPNLQIIVVNDGSEDDTMKLLFDTFELTRIFPIISQKIKTYAPVSNYYMSRNYPNLCVIDKEHSGKSDSLNIGINACTTPLFLSIDADTLLEKDTISLLIFDMLSHPHTIAVGGAIYILNGCEYQDGEILERRMSWSPIVAMQACEYLRAFLFGRTGWRACNGPLILSGALTLFERQAVIEIGGFLKDSPGEDMEVVVSLHQRMRANHYPYRIGFSFASVAWTHVPSDMNSLLSQRDRWHRGLIDSLLHHKRMFFNPKYGATGVINYPFQFIAEFMGPIVEFLGYTAVIIAMYFNIVDWRFAVLFFIATWGFSTVITLGTTLISMISFNKYNRLRDILLLLFLVVIENFGYRQIMSLCRVIATFRYFIKKIVH